MTKEDETRDEIFFNKILAQDEIDRLLDPKVLTNFKKYTAKGEQITYQIFIEPKGKYLEKTDEWKGKFLLKIKEQFSSKGLLKFIETSKYKIIGVPLYNQAEENKFKEDLLTVLE